MSICCYSDDLHLKLYQNGPKKPTIIVQWQNHLIFTSYIHECMEVCTMYVYYVHFIMEFSQPHRKETTTTTHHHIVQFYEIATRRNDRYKKTNKCEFHFAMWYLTFIHRLRSNVNFSTQIFAHTNIRKSPSMNTFCISRNNKQTAILLWAQSLFITMPNSMQKFSACVCVCVLCKCMYLLYLV